MSNRLSSLALIVDAEPRPAAWNMAMDEATLETARVPVLRFYRWERPAVSFGCFQPWTEVAARFPGRELVRRPTGGGAVEHGDGGEMATYALVVPRAAGALADLGERPAEAFRRVHEALTVAFVSQGFRVHLQGNGAASLGGACFHDQPVPGDVVLTGEGRKVAGAAQRRSRAGLLHQGSIRLAGVEVARLVATFAEALLGPGVPLRMEPTPEMLASAERLDREKYAQRAWTERR